MKLTTVDLRAVDWPRVEQSSCLIHQRMSYDYPMPIEDLRHQLVVFPPRNHGDQRRVTYRLQVSNADHQESAHKDAFGNQVVELAISRVETAIEFEAWMVVERRADGGPHRVHGAWLGDSRFLDPSPLTVPDDKLRALAAELIRGTGSALRVAERINSWVFRNLAYQPGITGVQTTAAEALALGGGVCQDYAHVMLALCRLCGVPARYVSGHMLWEGAMHAWVEVLVPCAERAGEGIAWAFDPTHGRRASLSYLTVAVGRDYADVSPTRGTFRAAAGGTLVSRQSVTLTSLRYRGAGTAPPRVAAAASHLQPGALYG